MCDPCPLAYHQSLTADNEFLPWTGIGVGCVEEQMGQCLPGQCPGGQDDMALATSYMKLVYFCLLVSAGVSLWYCEADSIGTTLFLSTFSLQISQMYPL